MSNVMPTPGAGAGGRLPSVAEVYGGDREARLAKTRNAMSKRWSATATVPVLLLVLVLVSIGVLFYHLNTNDPAEILVANLTVTGLRGEDGRAITGTPGELLAKEAEYMAKTSYGRELPSGMAEGSVLACWRAYGPARAYANDFEAEYGRPASTYADLRKVSSSTDWEREPWGLLSPEVARKLPKAKEGCEYDAAGVVLTRARKIETKTQRFQGVALMLTVTVWLGMVGWAARALENIRRSWGRSAGLGSAILSWMPLWVIPVVVLIWFSGLTESVMLVRGLLVLSGLIVAFYYWRTRAVVALQIWRGSGIDSGWASGLYWVPELVVVLTLFAAIFWRTFHPVVYGDPSSYDADSGDLILGVVGQIAAAAAIGCVFIYMVVVTILQTIGITQATNGKVPPEEQLHG